MEDTSNKIVSIIVVTCGVKNYIKDCLNSLTTQSYSAPEIIVIDNSFNSNFSQEINECYPGIKLYSSPRNLFYCEALNIGIKMSRGDFILCLNDDVILDRNFIKEALKGFGIDKGIGMISGKILRSDGKTIDSTRLFLSIWRTAKERSYGHRDTGRYKREEYIFGVNGAVSF